MDNSFESALLFQTPEEKVPMTRRSTDSAALFGTPLSEQSTPPRQERSSFTSLVNFSSTSASLFGSSGNSWTSAMLYSDFSSPVRASERTRSSSTSFACETSSARGVPILRTKTRSICSTQGSPLLRLYPRSLEYDFADTLAKT